MSQSTHHKSYYENLEKLIKEGEELLQHDIKNPQLWDEINEIVTKLKFKSYKAKISDSGINI